ncbi:Rap1a/Tai family immunity protein [Bradyrhizobium sp.]
MLLPGCINHLEELSPTVSTDVVYASGVCLGMISILAAVGTVLPADRRYCPPPTGTVTQAVRVVVKYLNDHPERLHERFQILAVDGLRAAWPCK